MHYNVAVQNTWCCSAPIFHLRYPGTIFFLSPSKKLSMFLSKNAGRLAVLRNLTGQREINFSVVNKMISWKDLFGILREYFYFAAT